MSRDVNVIQCHVSATDCLITCCSTPCSRLLVLTSTYTLPIAQILCHKLSVYV